MNPQNGTQPRTVCPGSHRPAAKVTRWSQHPFDRASRGLCEACGREYQINDRGQVIIRHHKIGLPR